MLQLFIEADDEIWVLNPPVCRSRTEKRTVAKNEVYFSSLSHIWNQVLFSSFLPSFILCGLLLYPRAASFHYCWHFIESRTVPCQINDGDE
jgi:hypothetical protein